MTKSERSKHYELYCEEDEIEHIKALNAHKKAMRGYKKGPCLICKTTENIERAHLYPMSQFALLINPGDIPLLSLCTNHHKIYDHINGLCLKG